MAPKIGSHRYGDYMLFVGLILQCNVLARISNEENRIINVVRFVLREERTCKIVFELFERAQRLHVDGGGGVYSSLLLPHLSIYHQ